MIRQILQFPDPLVSSICAPVAHFDDSLRGLISDLFETLRATERPSVGLSSNQVGDLRRVFVIDQGCGTRPRGDTDTWAIVNPKIEKRRGAQFGPEACLSLPEAINLRLERAKIINWSGQDGYGKPISGKFSGMLARIFQHELDHLNGFLITHRAQQQGVKI